MKYIISYKTFESLKSIDNIISSTNTENFKWDISGSGIKIFFDITPYNDKSQTPYGKLLILSNIMKDMVDRYKNNNWNNTLVATTHTGFIFSDGSILHSSSEFYSDENNGVKLDDSNSEIALDIKNNPKYYIIFDIGGDENDIKKIGDEILENIIENGYYGKSYNWCGIKKIFPDLNDILTSDDDIEFDQGGDKTFYCSQFVSYILIKSGIISQKDLDLIKKENNELNINLGKYDINPTELFGLIFDIGKLLKLIF